MPQPLIPVYLTSEQLAEIRDILEPSTVAMATDPGNPTLSPALALAPAQFLHWLTRIHRVATSTYHLYNAAMAEYEAKLRRELND